MTEKRSGEPRRVPQVFDMQGPTANSKGQINCAVDCSTSLRGPLAMALCHIMYEICSTTSQGTERIVRELTVTTRLVCSVQFKN